MERRAPFVLAWILFLLGTSVGQDDVARTKGRVARAAIQNPSRSSVAPAKNRPSASSAQKTLAIYSRLPLSFEPNQGQAGAPVKYLARGGQFNVFLTQDEVAFGFARRQARRRSVLDMEDSAALEPPELSNLELRLVGANPSSPVWGEEQLGGTANYLVGRDPSQWHVNLPTFAKVRYRNVYRGVDLLYYGNQGELESDFIIAPGANPEAVKLSVVGAKAITIASSGDLVLRMKDGELRLRKPLVYQTVGATRKEIAGGYVLAGNNQVSFRVAPYDHKQPLIIDPVLSYSTYLGGNGFDEATAIAVDSAGNAYITGDTTSTNFPTTLGPATGDMFVAKLSPTGTKLYATYVGGTAQLDFPTGIGVDALSNAYVVGQTSETNLPTTAGALRTTYQGGTFDGFVLSLNPAGTGFNYFTYLGGSAFDLLAAVAVDSLGNAYITGQTDSGDYPILNPFEPLAAAGDGGIFTTTNSGTNWTASATGLVNRNIAVVAVDPKTPTTIYAATLESGVIKSTNSGAAWNAINTGLTSLVIQALVVDPVTPANVYVGTGRGGVFVSNNGGTSWATMNAGLVGINVHALAIDPTSPGTLYASTGVNGVFKFASGAWSATGVLPQDIATAIVVDPTNNQNVYASFQNSGVYRSSNGGTSWAAFNTGLSSLQVAALAIDHGGHLYAGTRTGGVFLSTSGGSWTTINTGLPFSVFQALATDPTNNTTVYVGTFNGGVFRSTNNGTSWSEPASNGLNTTRVSALAIDPITPTNLYAGSQMVEAVVTKLSPSGGLVFSSYLGGGGGESGFGIAIDGDNGNLYVAGFTNSLNFPTVAPAQATMNGGISGFISKVKSDGSGLTYSTYLGGSGNSDQAFAIAADSAGNAYVTGLTNSADFPTLNPIQAALAGTSDAFLAKYNASGQKLFATYVGGEGTESGNAITATANTDGSTSAWVAGQTTSIFFPLANPIQLERGNQNSASNAGFISDFNFPASGGNPTLAFSTYLGTGCGAGCDTVAQAIGHDGTNNIYVAGRTMSNGFPAVNAVQNILAGPQNAFIAKIGATTSNADLSLTLNSFGPTTVVAGAAVNFSLTVTNHGPNDAPNVALGGRGGANLAIITCTATQGICGDNLQVLDKGFAELGTLASGTSATVAGTLQPRSACGVAGAPACPFLIEVDARSDANDPNPSNNSATANLTVLPGADLAVTLSAAPSPAPVQVGGTLNYIANVSNLGPSNASNVSAVFVLVPATAATFASLPTGCTNSAPGTLTCVLGPMPAGTAGLDTIPVTVNSLPITAEIVVSNTPEADPDPSNNSASVTTTLSASSVNNAELNGQYAFVARGFDPSGQAIAIGGSFTADGAGHITGGVKDVNLSSGVTADASIIAASSSYSVGADNRGQLTLTTASSGTHSFDFSLGSISSGVASLGHMIDRQSPSATNGSAVSGVFKKQDPTAFTLAALNGDWAFLDEGTDSSGGRFASAGRFTLNGGNLTLGSVDFNDNGVFDNSTTTASVLTGSLASLGTPLDTTNGRFVLTTTTSGGGPNPSDNALYVVSANEVLFMSIDAISANPLGDGSALRQNTAFCPTTGNCNFTNSALNGNAVIYTQGNSSSGVAGAADVNVGVLTFTLATTSFIGSLDENDGGTIYCPAGNICANPGGSTASGNYSVASNGRVTLTLGAGENHPPFFYMVNTNQAFLIGSSSSHVEAGVAENQVGPIATSSLGSAFGTEPPAVSGSLMFSGVQTITAIGSTTASLTNTTDDVNSVGPIPNTTRGGLREDVSVADDILTADPTTGRFTFASGTRVGYFINSNKRVAIDIEPTNTAPYVIISDNQSSSIGAEPDLAVGITANPSTGVFVGGPITYTVTVSNARSTPATGAVLTTVLLPSLTLNSVTPSQGSCAVGASPVASFTCSLGTVSQGTPVTVTIVAVAPASGTACGGSALGCIIVAADVTENEIDFNPADNGATATTPILQAGTTSCTGATTNWVGPAGNGGPGNWSTAANWSTGVVPNSSSVNVCIDNGKPVASAVTLDISATVGNLYVDSNDSLIISNNTALIVAGNISNSGQISVSAAGNTTLLQIAGGQNVSLSGGGTLTLSTSGNGTPVINQTSGGATLTNVNNTIQGQGQIGNNGLALVNQAGATINANVAAPLLINSSGITNAGLLAATGGGTLQTNTTVNNTGGTISSTGSGSAVQFLNGTTVQSGTLNASAGGVLGTAASNTATLDGTTHGALTNAGTYTGADNSATILRGTINNPGAIQIAAVGNTTFLQVAGGQNTSLAGGGTVTLSKAGNGTAIINQTSGGATLTNVDNTIQGQGEIGNNGLVLVNQAAGTVNANAAGPLTLDAPSITNQHVMEATSGGTLAVNGTTVNNNGSTILANGGTVQFTSTTIQGGTLNTLNNGVLGTAPSQTATLDGLSTHQGTLSNIGAYTAPNNSVTILQGTINNAGTILLAAAGNVTELQVLGGQTTSLTGAGTVTMSTTGNGAAIILQSSGGGILSNADNTIQGQGEIGNNGLALVNSGTIDANIVGKTLTIDAATPTNAGTLEATGGGILALSASTINNKSGIIKADAAGSTVQFVNNVTLQSGSLAATNGGLLGTAASNTATLDGSTLGQPITLSGTYTAANNSATILFGTINNTGAIQLSAAGNVTELQIRGGQNVILTGGGTVTMSTSGNGTPIINQTSGGSTLTNVNNTIQGRGEIGNNGLALVNQATINANVPGGTLTLDPVTLTNTGTVEATNSGALSINTSTVNNQGGTISVNGSASAVQFVSGATIQGGTLATANSGVLGTASGTTITLDGSTHGALTNAGTYTAANNSATVLVGTINNAGAIQVAAAGNITELQVAGGQNVILTGAGTVTLSTTGNGTAIINQTSGGSTLTNVNNLIQGQGQIGNNGLALINQAGGTINANVAGPLILNASAITNQSLLEATGGGTLQISTTVSSPGGTIAAAGTGSAVQLFTGTAIQGGTLSTSGSGGLGTVSGNNVTLNGSTSNGPVNNTGTYTGANSSATVLNGTINNTGAIQIAATGNITQLQILGGQNVTLTGAGAVTLSTSGNGTAIINQTSGGATLTNAGNTIQGQGQVGNNGLSVINQGTITANLSAAGSYTQTAGAIVIPAATTASVASFALSGGTAQVDGTLSSPGGVSVTGTATLFGTGHILGNLSAAGVIRPGDSPGILTVSAGGNYTQTSAGALNIPIGGTTLGTQYSQLNVVGPANLAGTLNVSLINGFNPVPGNSFTILTSTAISGTFATVNLPTLSSGNWQVTYNPASVVLTVSAAPLLADLAVAMTASPSPVPVLGSVTYQITVTNNGPNPATGVVLTDALPAGAVFASISDLTECVVSNGTLTCRYSSLAVGSPQAVNLILVPLAVPSGAGTFDNTASVAANETDPNLSNNSATQTVQVTGTTLPGGGAFRNLPGFSTNNLPGNDDNSTGSVPMNLTLNFFGVEFSSVFINNNGNVTFGSPLGTFTPFPLTSTNVQIIAPYFSDVETDFPTSGLVTYGNDTVNGRPAFGVNSPNVEYFGEGPATLLNLFQLVLVDRSDVGAGDFDIEFNYNQIQWETGDASGGTGGLGGSSARVGYSNGSQTAGSFFELPGSGIPGSFLDTNTTTGLIHNDLNSTQPGRYLFQVRAGTVQSSADLAISANGPPSAATGSTITYTLTATNLGPNTATGVTVTDTLPAGFTFVSATPSSICSPAGQPVVVTCNVGSLANGSNAIITIQASIPTTASGTATDTAVVSVPNNQDLNLGNNTATVLTNITVLNPDLTIIKTHNDPFAQGQTGATYTITVTNSGTGATTGTVTVNDTLPTGLTATAISGTGDSNWVCTLQPLGCTRSDVLAAGASYDAITLTVTVAANATLGQVTNTATVSGGGEVNTANDTANDVTNIVAAAAALVPTVAVIPPPDATGTTISYTVTITNNGPSAATSVTLTDQLTGNAGFVSASSDTMACPAPSATSLACTVAVLDNGASVTVTITVNLTGAGWDLNAIGVTSPVPNPNPAAHTLTVQRLAPGGNTVTGSNVAVQPMDSTSGASPAVLTFADVTRGGTTTLASAASGPAPPAGFRTGTPAVFYNLATTAGYAGTIGVALGFNSASFHHPAKVRLFHSENGAWVDRTVAINPAGAYAVARVTSLSPFALFEPINHVPEAKAGPDLSTVATSTQGAKVTLNASASFDADQDPLTYRWTGPFPEGNGVATGVNPTVTMPPGGSTVTLVVNDGEADSAPAIQDIIVTDFSMAAAAAGPTTISAGGSVGFSVTASPQFGPFSPAIALACLGLPQGAQCNFSTTTVSAGGSAATLTITTTARTAAALAPVRHRNLAPLYTLWMPLPAIALMGLGLRRRSRKRAAALMLLLLLGMMLLLVSCGGGSMGTTPPLQNGTPAGTFTVTVMGTANGSLQHTTTVTFTVQ